MPEPHRERSLFRLPWRTRRDIARDVDQELAFHLEMRASELIAAGRDADTAHRQAREEFGDLEYTRGYCRALDQRSARMVRQTQRLHDWRLDVRLAIRSLRRSPGFTAVALATLALAIGANTAIFSVARAVLLAPLPYGAPSELVRLSETAPGNPDERMALAPANYIDFRSRQRTLAAMGAFLSQGAMTWQPDRGDPAALTAVSVSPSLFGVLQVPPLVGGVFATPSDTTRAEDEVVLGHAFWQRALGADARAVGRSLRLDGRAYRIAGVMPARFSLGWDVDVYLPLDLTGRLADGVRARRQHYLSTIGRLAPGVSLEAARADLSAIAAALAVEHPDANADRTAIVEPLRDVMVSDLSTPVTLMQGAALLVLLLACANLGNLTLSRASARRREVGIRAALGAGRGRLARELFTESVLLGLAGGAIGMAIAFAGTRTLLALNPDALPPTFHVAIDGGVLLFSLALSVLGAMLFGLLPALQAARADLVASIHEGNRGTAGSRGGERTRRILAAVQVAFASVLLVGAGLLVRSFRQLTSVELGFVAEQVTTGRITLSGARYESPEPRLQFIDQVFGQLDGSPGVIAAGTAYPLLTDLDISTALRIEGEPVDEANLPALRYVAVAGDFFEALGIPLLAGRMYDATDRPDGPKVAIINQTAARRYFPRRDAVGRRIRIGPDPNGPWMTVVGVVADIRDQGPGIEPRPTLFANYRQESWMPSMGFVVRTAPGVSGEPQLRAALRAADPALALSDVDTLAGIVHAGLASRRFALALASGFAGLALTLAAVGIYGVLAYGVTRRFRELGVRAALGATRRQLIGLVLRQGIAWSILGLGVGIAAATVATRLLGAMLYGVGHLDPWTYGATALTFLLIITVASVAPAARAARADPTESMRAE